MVFILSYNPGIFGAGGLLLQFLELKGTDWGVRVEEESHPSLDEPLW